MREVSFIWMHVIWMMGTAFTSGLEQARNLGEMVQSSEELYDCKVRELSKVRTIMCTNWDLFVFSCIWKLSRESSSLQGHIAKCLVGVIQSPQRSNFSHSIYVHLTLVLLSN